MNWVDIDKIKNSIGFMHEVYNLKIINKGYSGDIKYTFSKEGKNYLIRFNKMNQYDREIPNMKKSEKLLLVVDFMENACKKNVKCPLVYNYGVLPQYELTYIITSFIEGEVAESALKKRLGELESTGGSYANTFNKG